MTVAVKGAVQTDGEKMMLFECEKMETFCEKRVRVRSNLNLMASFAKLHNLGDIKCIPHPITGWQ